jgi:tripartite-type tricarboxylate transporter receptor subunit TctC
LNHPEQEPIVNPFDRTRRQALLALAAAALPARTPMANTRWPQKPVKLIVPFAAGGSNDNIARIIGQKLGDLLGQPFVIENRGGGGGVIGTDSVARAPADGYTLLFASSSIVTNALSGKKVNFDPVTGFTPLGKVGVFPLVIVAATQLPVKSLAELIAYAKARPGTLHYGTAGIGATNHLATELFAHAAGIELVHVPYKGISQSYTDLMGGSLQMMLPSVTAVAPQIKSGKMRGLAVTGRQRSPVLPDLPTAAEAGLPGFQLEAWFGLLGPARLPAEIQATLNQALNQVLGDAEVDKMLRAESVTPQPGAPDDLRKLLQDDLVMWKKIIRDANINLNKG